MAFIEFRGVRKAFGSKVVFQDLNLDIHKNESITIIGGSGMGKSVALKLLIGLIPIDAGTITFDGEVISGLKERELTRVRRRIGMLFQGAALFDSLSVRENVAYGLREHLKLSEEEIEARVAQSLADIGLPGIEDMWPADLSGGMKKRVGLARAVALRPEVLLYDEPTTGLDPINIDRINKLILKLKATYDVTSIVVTHDMGSAFEISDRIAMIDRGYVIWTGTVEETRKSPDPRVRNFIEGNASEDASAAELLRYGG